MIRVHSPHRFGRIIKTGPERVKEIGSGFGVL